MFLEYSLESYYRTDACNVPLFLEVNFCRYWGVGLYTSACPGRENQIAIK